MVVSGILISKKLEELMYLEEEDRQRFIIGYKKDINQEICNDKGVFLNMNGRMSIPIVYGRRIILATKFRTYNENKQC